MLSNPRHELFAQYLHEGMTADEAFVKAGYRRSRGNASRLKANESIQKRLEELRERGQRVADVTIQSLTEMLQECYANATASNQISAAVSAAEKLGKLHGLFVERSENVNTNFVVSDTPADEMTDEDWLSTAQECRTVN